MDGVGPPSFVDENWGRAGWLSSVFRFIQRRTKAVTVTASYTVAADVGFVRANASGGAVTITLPASGDWGGRTITVIKTDSSANAVTLSRGGSDDINGVNSISITTQYYTAAVAADGTTHWNITSRYPPTVLS